VLDDPAAEPDRAAVRADRLVEGKLIGEEARLDQSCGVFHRHEAHDAIAARSSLPGGRDEAAYDLVAMIRWISSFVIYAPCNRIPSRKAGQMQIKSPLPVRFSAPPISRMILEST